MIGFSVKINYYGSSQFSVESHTKVQFVIVTTVNQKASDDLPSLAFIFVPAGSGMIQKRSKKIYGTAQRPKKSLRTRFFGWPALLPVKKTNY